MIQYKYTRYDTKQDTKDIIHCTTYNHKHNDRIYIMIYILVSGKLSEKHIQEWKNITKQSELQ